MTGRSIARFVVAAIAEIGGAYLVWEGVREGKGWALAVLGGLALVAYGLIATFAALQRVPTGARRLRRRLRRRLAGLGGRLRRLHQVVALARGSEGLANRAPFDAVPRRRFVASVEDLRIEVYFAGPFDRSGLRVDGDLLEDLPPLVDRGEHPTTGEHVAEPNRLDRPIGEDDADPMPLESLCLGDLDDFSHVSGSICSGRPVCLEFAPARLVPFSHEALGALAVANRRSASRWRSQPLRSARRSAW